jgi:hypothetical protein
VKNIVNTACQNNFDLASALLRQRVAEFAALMFLQKPQVQEMLKLTCARRRFKFLLGEGPMPELQEIRRFDERL